MVTKKKLLQAHDKCIAASVALSSALTELSKLVTEVYGEEVRADICNGSEIEFRRLGPDGFGVVDDFDHIWLEDVLEKINK